MITGVELHSIKPSHRLPLPLYIDPGSLLDLDWDGTWVLGEHPLALVLLRHLLLLLLLLNLLLLLLLRMVLVHDMGMGKIERRGSHRPRGSVEAEWRRGCGCGEIGM
jgi:hypothetical protein